ncbi:MAG: hypothetical protein A2Y17_05405 [Clostridiales bacterium GWF2_38_85]|nr:MAG: hypothetical protein A2Y17_05405 [Clostridiales bacterium GWF2_38_85]HBL83333.1 hypothetical protein [Clostridiales bacterium]
MSIFNNKKIKQLVAFFMLAVMLVPFTACGDGDKDNSTDSTGEASNVTSEAESAKELIPNEKAAAVWDSTWADEINGFANASTIYGFDFYKNRQLSNDDAKDLAEDDYKYIFFGENNSRVVNLTDGYAITLPTTEFTTDYSLSALRSRYYGDNFALTITKENKSPYGNTPEGWNIYLTEWVIRYIDSIDFLGANNLRRIRKKQELTDMIEGYTVIIYNMEFQLPTSYEYQNYDIAIVRKDDEYVEFYLFVMKSTERQYEKLDEILKSFTELDEVGVAKNDETPFELKIPEYWNDETKAYFDKLQNQTNVSWGAFSASMPDDKDGTYNMRRNQIIADQARLEATFDYNFDILPTYTALKWGDTLFDFPSGLASELAGGNGFNGKPVLQFTYQFTTLNNTNLYGYNPMFDIACGKYDEQFNKIAQQIKEYDKPVLFRLNNEMNSDWTSYAGILSLLDPDVFVLTWQRLYDIFREEGVDNCIWIFNPIAKSCPFSSWGEYLCYMPGVDYMQLLGLTSYEMNNNTSVESFKDMYTYVYEKNTPYFENYSWIISEFGCGSGGEVYYDWGQGKYFEKQLGRNETLQANWVKEMFKYFNNNQTNENAFCKNIKAAIWFSVNDYVDLDGESRIVNFLKLDSSLTKTLEEFRKGLNPEE